MPGKRYPHRYRYGKQELVIPFNEVKGMVVKAKLALNEEAFFWFLYYLGCRKSEAYELIVSKCKLTDEALIVDLGQRKKNSAITPAIELKRKWYGVSQIVLQYNLMRKRNPKWKNIFFQQETDATRTTKKGRIVKVKKTVKKLVKEHWLFPNIQSTRAWEIAKLVLGKKLYPHFLRLNRLTEIGTDTESFTVLKSYSGLKTMKSMDAYLGVSEKATRKAESIIDEQVSG